MRVFPFCSGSEIPIRPARTYARSGRVSLELGTGHRFVCVKNCVLWRFISLRTRRVVYDFWKNDVFTVINYWLIVTLIAQWSIDNISSKKSKTCMLHFHTTLHHKSNGLAWIEPERIARVSTNSRDPVPLRNWSIFRGRERAERALVPYHHFLCLKITIHVRDRM